MIRSFIVLSLLAAGPAFAGGDGAEISRSRGKAGGAVVLWPRVVPEAQDPSLDDLATKLQQRLEAIAHRNVSESRTVVRPKPERVCPQEGCKGVSLSVMLAHQEGGCAAVALVGAPGAEPSVMIPWAGKVVTAGTSLAFRQPPESQVTVTEFVPCGELLTRLDDGAVEAAVANVAP